MIANRNLPVALIGHQIPFAAIQHFLDYNRLFFYSNIYSDFNGNLFHIPLDVSLLGACW